MAMADLFNFFISTAHAEATTVTPPPPAGGSTSFFIMMAAVVAVFYFTAIRPQNKRAQEQRNLLNDLSKGDEVMLTCGLIGKIVKITETHIMLQVNDTTELTFQKTAVTSVLPKGSLKAI